MVKPYEVTPSHDTDFAKLVTLITRYQERNSTLWSKLCWYFSEVNWVLDARKLFVRNFFKIKGTQALRWREAVVFALEYKLPLNDGETFVLNDLLRKSQEEHKKQKLAAYT